MEAEIPHMYRGGIFNTHRKEVPAMNTTNAANVTVIRKYLRPDELAVRWSVATKTLAKWRCEGTGPNYVKLSNGIVRYPVTAIEAFELAAEGA